jgi:hypothetical protein
LPFFEQQSLYDQAIWSRKNGNGHPDNAAFRNVVLTVVICPSNGQEPQRPASQVPGYRWGGWPDANGNRTAGGTDYVGNMGHIWGGWKDCGAVPEFNAEAPANFPNMFVRGQSPGTPWVNGEYIQDQTRCNGVFRYHGSAKIADVIDGTSNTLLVFEDMHWRGGNSGPHDKDPCDDTAWASPLAAVNTMRNPINNQNPAWLQGAGDRRCHGWSSNHAGGAQTALCDGSVRFVSETINNVTRYQVGVRNDGLAIGAGW